MTGHVKLLITIFLVSLAGNVAGRVVLRCVEATIDAAETPVPRSLPAFASYRQEVILEQHSDQCCALSYAFGARLKDRRPIGTGSDQHFELDGFIDAGAYTAWWLQGMNNLMTQPDSQADHVRQNTSNGHVAGRIGEWSQMMAGGTIAPTGHVQTVRHFVSETPTHADGTTAIGDKWSFVDADPKSRHLLRGDTQVDSLTFTNGWRFRIDGERLVLCDSHGACRSL